MGKSIWGSIFWAWIETYSSKRIYRPDIHSWIHQRLTRNKEGTQRPSLQECFGEYSFVADKQLPIYIYNQLHNAEANISTGWLVWEAAQSPWWWDAPLFAGLAFRPTKNGGWKESALCFPGHHYLLSVIIPSLCPRALMATMMLLPMFLIATFKLWPRPLCLDALSVAVHSTLAFFFFSFFFRELFYTPYVHSGWGMLKIAWRVESRIKKRRWLWEIKRRKPSFFSLYRLSASQAKTQAKR